jgi:hypothetical protein
MKEKEYKTGGISQFFFISAFAKFRENFIIYIRAGKRFPSGRILKIYIFIFWIFTNM